MKHHTVRGGGSVSLHVVETGNEAGPPIVFLHGWSLSHAAWNRQLTAPSLGERFRLIALDLRGHGDSEKPLDAYGDSRAWADDVAAVLDALALRPAVLCGWSYGGYAIADYARHHGQGRLAGVVYAGAATDMGGSLGYKFLGSGWDGVLPGAFSDGAEEAANVMRTFVRNCSAAKLPFAEEIAALGIALSVPPRVRKALFARRLRNDDLLESLAVPALVAHGDADAIVDIETGRHIAALVPGAALSVYAGIGHAPFWEDAERFNRELFRFAAEATATG
jgi:pimeloyl-ACP methyl ester carboxylesterase